MAVFQEATGADLKHTNINILQSQSITILVSKTPGQHGRTPKCERPGEKKEKSKDRGKEIESESVGVQD